MSAPSVKPNNNDFIQTARAIALNHPSFLKKQLLVDISELIHRDAATGIQRVVRSILSELIENPPLEYIVEPVYATTDNSGYRYARDFTMRLSGRSASGLEDQLIETQKGDISLGIDLQAHVVSAQSEHLKSLRLQGIKIYFVVYDLLPILQPHSFPGGTDLAHSKWLETIACFDGAICISRSVASGLKDWLDVKKPLILRPYNIGWFHLGADVKSSVPSYGMPESSGHVQAECSIRPSFLMVGTIEPRKGHKQTLLAFERLWDQGLDINLVIVGKNGWGMDIFVETLHAHAQINRRLFWLNGISDEYLEKIYAASTCLIAASEGEGFGLPLIEAAQHKLPIIARDIPVFREVAGEHAFYFSGLTSVALANAVSEWLLLDKEGKAPQSSAMPWLTWKQSTQKMLDVVLKGNWFAKWMPDNILRFWGNDSRLSTQVGKRSGLEIMSTGERGHLLSGPDIPLNVGNYRIVIRGSTGNNNISGSTINAVMNKGRCLLAESGFNDSTSDNCLASLPITIKSPCTDFEIKIWVESHFEATISMLEIQPLQASIF